MSRRGQTTEPIRAWWLVLADGLRVPVRGGVLIGRHYECDVVIDNEHVSRRHAHVRPTASGVEVIPLGRNPLVIDGAERAGTIAIAEGAAITIGNVVLRVEAGDTAGIDAPWLLDHGDASFSLRRMPFAIGGDDHDDLVIPGWPAAGARLYRVETALFVEADADGIALNERALAPGTIEAVGDGDRIGFGAEVVRARQPPVAEATPTRPVVMIPDRVQLQMLPRGARLTLSFAAVDRTLMVAERRLELLTVLLRPPAPHEPGAYIPDALIVDRVWPRSDRADTSDLAVLVHRLRRDLIKVGANGLAIISRAPGGDGTRFTLRRDTVVTIG